MSDFDVRCVNCLHRSHENKECSYCPAPTKNNPGARCTNFTRADMFIARCLARMEQSSQNSHGQLMAGLSTIFDLMCEVWPEASDKLKARLEERQKASEAAIEAEQDKRRVEAEAAYKEATSNAAVEAVVGEYTNNIVQFPTAQAAIDPNTPQEHA